MTIHFIKKIWLGEIDEQVHAQFVRFSRGRFENRTVIGVAKNKKIVLNSTFELSNELVIFCASLGPTFSASGILLSRQNPQSLLQGLDIKAIVKQKTNIYETKIDTGLTSEQINKLASSAYYMLFDLQARDISLRMKKKLPRPSKGSKKKVDDKFCRLELDSKFFPQLYEEFLFDLPKDFKKARISHAYDISQIILPQGEKDFEQIRQRAQRKGRIVRKLEIDGKEKTREKEFEA